MDRAIVHIRSTWDISLEVKYVLAKDKSRWQNPHVPPRRDSLSVNNALISFFVVKHSDVSNKKKI